MDPNSSKLRTKCGALSASASSPAAPTCADHGGRPNRPASEEHEQEQGGGEDRGGRLRQDGETKARTNAEWIARPTQSERAR